MSCGLVATVSSGAETVTTSPEYAITKRLLMEIKTTILVAELVMGRDEYGMRCIATCRKRQKGPGA